MTRHTLTQSSIKYGHMISTGEKINISFSINFKIDFYKMYMNKVIPSLTAIISSKSMSFIVFYLKASGHWIV